MCRRVPAVVSTQSVLAVIVVPDTHKIGFIMWDKTCSSSLLKFKILSNRCKC